MDHATLVRAAATGLKDAVAAARADGYRVDGVGNLDGIGVSETGKVKQPVAEQPLNAAPTKPATRSGAPKSTGL